MNLAETRLRRAIAAPDRKVLPMVAEAKEQIDVLRDSPSDAEYLENATTLLALWRKESRDRTGITVHLSRK